MEKAGSAFFSASENRSNAVVPGSLPGFWHRRVPLSSNRNAPALPWEVSYSTFSVARSAR